MSAQPSQHATSAWRTSSASGGAGECVEVATSDTFVLARDSRDRSGAVLEFAPSQWLRFIGHIRDGRATR
jgi:Domain of unknown function (DUF397)